MWQDTGSTNKWNLSCYNPLVEAFFFVLVDLFEGGGGSTAAEVTLDTVADESKKMADDVASKP